MNVQPLSVNQQVAAKLLREYKAHRGSYDKLDMEIERIYRVIARGKTVISVNDAIARTGFDELGRPKLALCQAGRDHVHCNVDVTNRQTRVQFRWSAYSSVTSAEFRVPVIAPRSPWCRADTPRIPPQHRPSTNLSKYHILWEAEWTNIPRDPYLLRRIGKDAWIVLAAWDLTDVEVSVMRSHLKSR